MSDAERSAYARVSASKRYRDRILLTGAVLIAEIAHLAWEYFHGGVPSHHIMQRADLPAISNWWGLVLLPALAWFLIGRMQKRAASTIRAGFALSLCYGAALALAFTQGWETVNVILFFALFPLALVFPLNRSEYVLGFILGMTFTFGAVLSTVVASVFASISAVAQLGIRYVRSLFAS